MGIITPYPAVPLLQKDLIDDGAGYYPTKIGFDVLGAANSVGNTRTDVSNIGAAGAAAVYVFPPAGGIQMRIISTSANDAAAGTGVRTVTIHYLDANYAIQTETITMNGVAAVNTTATNILRVNEIHGRTWGTGLTSAGDITLENVAGTVIYARMPTGYNRSRNAVFTIPAGKTGYLTHWDASSGTTVGTHYTQFDLRMTTHDSVLLDSFVAHDAIGTLNSGMSIYYDIPIRLPAKTDIKVSVISDAGGANAIVNSHFSGWYE